MRDFDDLTVEKFVGMIRDIVRDILKEESSRSNIEKYYNGIVKAVSDDNITATVDIGDMMLENISNKTGVSLTINTDYLLRMEFDINNGTKVYLDNILVYDKKNFSNVYCTINNIYQQSGGQTILKSLKYKFNR